MQVDQTGEAVPEHIDHANCRRAIKMDNLWECLTVTSIRCPDQVAYGPVKYCMHTKLSDSGVRTRGEGSGSDR